MSKKQEESEKVFNTGYNQITPEFGAMLDAKREEIQEMALASSGGGFVITATITGKITGKVPELKIKLKAEGITIGVSDKKTVPFEDPEQIALGIESGAHTEAPQPPAEDLAEPPDDEPDPEESLGPRRSRKIKL